MRIRTVKPEILIDEKAAALTDTEWRMFVSLIVLSDDYGNFRASPAFLRTQIFWAFDCSLETVAKVRDSLARVSLVSLYEVHGQSYGHVNGWEKHQRVDHPGKPLCPGNEQVKPTTSTESSRDIRETFASIHESLAPDPDRDPDRDQEGTCSRARSAHDWLTYFNARFFQVRGKQRGCASDAKSSAGLQDQLDKQGEDERTEDWGDRERIVDEFLARSDRATQEAGWKFAFFVASFDGLRIPPEKRPANANRGTRRQDEAVYWPKA